MVNMVCFMNNYIQTLNRSVRQTCHLNTNRLQLLRNNKALILSDKYCSTSDDDLQSDKIKSAVYIKTVVPGKGSLPEPSVNDDLQKDAIKPVVYSKNVVPGKGPPPEPPVDCCMSGCANCVWIAYADELKDYYCDGGQSAAEALELIENPSLRAFVKLELKLR